MWRQDKVSFIRAHENAFLDFGGVPHTVRLDNLKADVARACTVSIDAKRLVSTVRVSLSRLGRRVRFLAKRATEDKER